mgnify:CR=1 FL=1
MPGAGFLVPGAGAGESGVESGGESGRCILGFNLEDESGGGESGGESGFRKISANLPMKLLPERPVKEVLKISKLTQNSFSFFFQP